jgi:hypothetical protein
VPCRIANELFEEFAEATHEHWVATDDLSMLAGHRVANEAFAEALKVANKKRLKSRTARHALEQHREEHGCNKNCLHR